MTEDHEHEDPETDAVSPAKPNLSVYDEQDMEEMERLAERSHEAADGDTDEPGDAPDASAQPGTAAAAKAARDEQKRIDKKFAAFKAEAERHAGRVAVIGEEEAQDFLQCPMCAPDEGQPELVGWLLPVKPSDEKIAAIRTAIGLAPKIDYRDDPHSKVCETCGGLRSVKPTGLEYGDTLLTCADCDARGWVPTDEKRGGLTPNGASATGITGPTVVGAQLDPDRPEVAALKAEGYTVIAPFTSGG